jgi:uncharacterized protein YndB with AHSA1/START domain
MSASVMPWMPDVLFNGWPSEVDFAFEHGLRRPGHQHMARAARPFDRQQAMAGWDGVIEGQVMAVDPPGHLAYTWVALGVVTEVVLTLETTPTGTRLTVAQSGFAETQAQNYAGARYGWTHFLDRLAQHLGYRVKYLLTLALDN